MNSLEMCIFFLTDPCRWYLFYLYSPNWLPEANHLFHCVSYHMSLCDEMIRDVAHY